MHVVTVWTNGSLDKNHNQAEGGTEAKLNLNLPN